ncbi:MAG: hypothetical protein QOI48_3996 [Solirubrobacteraceae bacterium]|jgi:hypothetical protein|nr:hypothetical protein [Solirubrobacteraceae bacterium]
MTVESTTKDKQITIDVPEDRVAEFYAFYGRFLAGFPGRRRHGLGPRGHRCGPHREDRQTETEAAVPAQRPHPERLRPDIADA